MLWVIWRESVPLHIMIIILTHNKRVFIRFGGGFEFMRDGDDKGLLERLDRRIRCERLIGSCHQKNNVCHTQIPRFAYTNPLDNRSAFQVPDPDRVRTKISGAFL